MKKSLLQKDSYVILLEKTGTIDHIDDIKAEWFKVKTGNNEIGYVFSYYLKKIEPISKEYYNDLPEYEPRKINCKDINNSGMCADAIERANYKKFNKYFKRDYNILSIFLNNGKIISFKDNLSSQHNKIKTYRFLEYIKDINCVLIRANYYEGSDYLLIHVNSGKSVYVWNVPLLISPDKKRIVVTSEGFDDGYSMNGIQIFKIENGSIVSEYERIVKYCYPNNPRWISNDKIIIDKIYRIYPNPKGYYFKDSMVLFYLNNKWINTTPSN